MAGRFMNKETVASEAERLGVDLTGLTWQHQLKAILEAQTAEKEAENLAIKKQIDLHNMVQKAGKELSEDEIKTILFNEDVDDPFVPVIEVGKEVYIHVDNPEDPMEQMRGKILMIAPEMAPTTNQLFGYEEELGDEIVVEEVVHDVDAAYKASKDLVTGTYHVTGKTGKKVIAHSALPKQGAGITFRPDVDRVPVVTFHGRSGYLWTHHRLPNIKQLLIESGYYEDYRNRFKDEPFIWHAAGKLLVCDRNLAESVLRDIERKAREERVRLQQNAEYIQRQLGE